MPTAAKLIGGIGLGLTAMLAAYYFALEQDDHRIAEKFILWNFPVGFFVGWYSLGHSPGNGNFAAIAGGIRSSVLLLISCSLFFSLIFIFANLKANHLENPIDLPLRWIELSFENAVLAMRKEVALTLLIGGCISGLVTYQSSRRWS